MINGWYFKIIFEPVTRLKMYEMIGYPVNFNKIILCTYRINSIPKKKHLKEHIDDCLCNLVVLETFGLLLTLLTSGWNLMCAQPDAGNVCVGITCNEGSRTWCHNPVLYPDMGECSLQSLTRKTASIFASVQVHDMFRIFSPKQMFLSILHTQSTANQQTWVPSDVH